VEFPLVTPSTLQVTVAVPVTNAVNCCVCVVMTTAASAGVIVIGATVNGTPALGKLSTVTTTLPDVAPCGTGTAIAVALQLVTEAAVPLNVIVLEPWVAPKLAPVTTTGAPTAAEDGDKLEMLGAGTTLKVTPVLDTPATVTTTSPVLAPAGTAVTMVVAFQLLGAAAVALKVTVLEPWLDPKFEPEIVTDAPGGADDGEMLLIMGFCRTVKAVPALARPPAVTTTGPVIAPAGTGAMIDVALQLVGVAAVPLNVTVLAPWDAPKFEPVIVTEVPASADAGTMLVIVGVGGGGGDEELLPQPARPSAAATTTPRQYIPARLAKFPPLTV
jgi:hypothetical protein